MNWSNVRSHRRFSLKRLNRITKNLKLVFGRRFQSHNLLTESGSWTIVYRTLVQCISLTSSQKNLQSFFFLHYATTSPEGIFGTCCSRFDTPQLSTSWKIGEWTSVRRKMEQTINKVTNLTQHKHRLFFVSPSRNFIDFHWEPTSPKSKADQNQIFRSTEYTKTNERSGLRSLLRINSVQLSLLLM